MNQEGQYDPNREDRIRIANEQLSALLRQGSDPLMQNKLPANRSRFMDEDEVDADGRKKVYVDWPDEDDDGQYRFVLFPKSSL